MATKTRKPRVNRKIVAWHADAHGMVMELECGHREREPEHADECGRPDAWWYFNCSQCAADRPFQISGLAVERWEGPYMRKGHPRALATGKVSA